MKDLSVERKRQNKYFDEFNRLIGEIDMAQLEKTAAVLLETYHNNCQVYLMGNGGSAATASHLASDLIKGFTVKSKLKRQKKLKVCSLTDNAVLLTALANDLVYEDVFVEQLRGKIGKHDLLIAISCSGRSPNILKAIRYAKKQGAAAAGFFGPKKNCLAGGLADYPVYVPSQNYGLIEAVHVALGHLLAALFFQELEKK